MEIPQEERIFSIKYLRYDNGCIRQMENNERFLTFDGESRQLYGYDS